MAGIKHVTKRAFNRAKTSKKRINSGLNQEFVDHRRRLNEIASALRKMRTSVIGSRQIWLGVAKYQHEFAGLLSSSFPEGGAVQAHAKEVEVTMRELQVAINDDDDKGVAHNRILDVVDSYLALVDEISKEYKPVEVACSEKMRYEHKVSKLERKKGKSDKQSKISEKLNRNLGKLNDARTTLDDRVVKTTKRMRDAFDKHEAVLQCAHHAFWMANHTFLSSIDKTTGNIRAESVAVHERLLDVKVEEDKRLTPIPRQSVIEPRREEEEQQQQKEEEQEGNEMDSSSSHEVTVEDQHQDECNEAKVEARPLSESSAVDNIPDVPTDRPTTPAPATYTPAAGTAAGPVAA